MPLLSVWTPVPAKVQLSYMGEPGNLDAPDYMIDLNDSRVRKLSARELFEIKVAIDDALTLGGWKRV